MSAKDGVRRVEIVARRLGFEVSRTKGGHLRFDKVGVGVVFFSGTPGDRRAILNGIAKLRRVVRQQAQQQ